jgi:hypothetical protein
MYEQLILVHEKTYKMSEIAGGLRNMPCTCDSFGIAHSFFHQIKNET